MAQKVKEVYPGIFYFICPGCSLTHPFHVGAAHPDGKGWEFNGSLEKPSFRPSLLVYPHARGEGPPQPRCHSFVTDGKIEYCADSEHELAGKTVEIPDWDEEYRYK